MNKISYMMQIGIYIVFLIALLYFFMDTRNSLSVNHNSLVESQLAIMFGTVMGIITTLTKIVDTLGEWMRSDNI